MKEIKLQDTRRSELGALVRQGYDTDIQSRVDSEKYWDEAKKLVGLMPPDKSNPRLENGSNVNIPIILNSAIVFGSRAYSVFFRGNDVVKAQVLGDDSGIYEVDVATGEQKEIVPSGYKRGIADRIGQHMSYQLLYQMHDWVEGMDRLFSLLPIYGSMFKKTYYDPISKKNVSEVILPKYLVVHSETRDLETCPRITHSFGLYPYEIRARIASGEFYSVSLSEEDDGQQHEILEQHLRYDLDGDGYDEPIIITVYGVTNEVLKVEKGYIEDDVTKKGGKIVDIKSYCAFTKFGFLPNPTGGFYDIGFGFLLYQLTHTLNSTVNQLIDAGTLGNSPFFMLEKTRIKGGDIKVSAGKGIMVNNDAKPLRDSVYQMQFNQPDSVLLQTFQFLFEYARNLGGMRDVLEGQMRSDQAAGATVMQIEEGMNEFKAIFKRIYRSLSKEYKKLFILNSKYLDEKEYFRLMDTQDAILRKDYDVESYDVAPIADPEYLTSTQRMAQAQFILSLLNTNAINTKVAIDFALKNMNMPQNLINDLLAVEPSNPELALQQSQIELEREKYQAMLLKEQNRAKELELKMLKVPAELDKIKADTLDVLSRAEARDEELDLKYYDKAIEHTDRQRARSVEGKSTNAGGDADAGNQTAEATAGASVGE